MIGFCFPHGGEEFEYDLRGLLGSFFPGQELKKLEADEDASSCEQIYMAPAPDRTRPYEDIKNSFKRRVYDELSSLTGRSLPWGTLTGIRPVKLFMQQLEDGKRPAEIAAHMRSVYYISNEKLSLALSIAQREKALLANLHGTDGYSLYVGIPFCPSRCLYCSFTSYPADRFSNRIDEYLETLFYEMEQAAPLLAGRPLDTVYIGGGTPTALSASQLDRLLGRIDQLFPTETVREFTVEAGRPDSIDAEKLRVLKDHPVDRISINPQTMQQKTLDRIGRKHTVEDFLTAYELARSLDFANINMDLILGLPGEGPEEVADTLRQITKLRPDDLTVHALAVKRASRLKMEAEGAVTAGLGQAESEEMMRLAEQTAAGLGLFPYYLYRQKNMAGNLENVGYAAPGKEGLYNILMMEEKQSILALGAGNISKAVWPDGRIERADNVKDLTEYTDRIEEMLERKRKLWL